ncbi:flavoprotein [Kribbella sp. HUAS MG21]|uniref:Flavoprotein n=1 Tax=Kribbella sp. HUAS MG21 TaxID=3160966 RepID=A0AAU7TFV2_9ACTN
MEDGEAGSVNSQRVLHLFICGAGPARRIHELIDLAHDEGWDVYCAATESAVQHFLDTDAVAERCGHPVRTTYRRPGETPTPSADAVIVAPATYNTINKWAAGVADTYVLTQLAELTGLGVRIVVLPFVNQSLAANRIFLRSVEELRSDGVRVLFGPGEFEPHPPRTGDDAMTSFPWKLALRAARD